MKLVSFWRDQEVRLGFLLDDEILEPGLARSSLAPGEERMCFETQLRSFGPANPLSSWHHV